MSRHTTVVCLDFLYLCTLVCSGGKGYTMYKRYEKDELKARFTKWMKVVVYRERLNYLKSCSRRPETTPLDDIPEEWLRVDMPFLDQTDVSKFDFEEEKLAFAFARLSAMKRQILIRLFVLEEKPEGIARDLGCTVQNIYNQRSLALKQLRHALERGEPHE